MKEQEEKINPDNNSFDLWLSTFLEEKGLDELVLEFEDDKQWNYFPINVLKEYLSMSGKNIQNKIKTKLVQLDFYNQNIKDFLEYTVRLNANSYFLIFLLV